MDEKRVFKTSSVGTSVGSMTASIVALGMTTGAVGGIEVCVAVGSTVAGISAGFDPHEVRKMTSNNDVICFFIFECNVLSHERMNVFYCCALTFYGVAPT